MADDPGQAPTAPLDDFLIAYEDDDNWWWRIGSGHHMNLFDEAVQRVREAQREAWDKCVHWFALLGPLSDHQRININVILEAEEANPYRD